MEDKNIPLKANKDLLSFGAFLDLHRKHPPVENALEKSLFDAHFLSCSPLASRARRLFLEAGFKFKIPEASEEMSCFGFNSAYTLPLMYAAKTIYYRSNTAILESINEKFPHFEKYSVRYIVPNFEKEGNKIFHETVHFLNFKKFFGETYFDYRESFADAETVDWLLIHLAIESSVLAVELLSTVVSPGVANDYARHLSSHQVAEFPKDYDIILKEGFGKMGARQTYQMLCYGFLAANLFPSETSLDEGRFAVLNDVFKNPTWVADILERCMKLNPWFRTVANSRYFLSLRYEKDYDELLKSVSWPQATVNPKVIEIFEFNFETLIKPEFVK